MPVLPKEQLDLAAELRQERLDRKRGSVREKRDFLLKVHKRKGKEGQVFQTFAIFDNVAQKQITQLTESTTPDAHKIVDNIVQSLNEGTVTKDEAISSIAAYKNIMP